MSSASASISVGNIKANLPILTGLYNFRRWYNTWFVVLRGAEYWSVVSDGDDRETRPVSKNKDSADNFEARLRDYDKRNDAAHAAILPGVSEELQDVVSSCAMEKESARVAMRILKEKFDLEMTTSTFELFNNFFGLKMEEGESLVDHLSRFEAGFQHIVSQCSESKQPSAVALKNFLCVEDVKVMCLFRSLPASMENIIDNLMTKDSIKLADVSKRHLDLQSQKTANGSNSSSKAYFAAKDSLPSQVKKKKECNWCKKRGENYQGHVHSECRKLKASKEKQKSDGNGKFDNPQIKANLAATSPTYSSPDVVSMEDFTIKKAFTTCFSASNLPTHWILDSGSSSHMTSRREQFVSMNNHRSTVTVANGEQIPVLGIGTIHLDL